MKLFGTDGIRANSKSELLNYQSVIRLGYSIGSWAKHVECKSIIVGKDTRESSTTIERWLSIALENSGIDIKLIGIVPTPAVSYICRELDCCGIMITASHNPYYDNGIKIFCKSGKKTTDLDEQYIEDWYQKFADTKYETEMFNIKNNYKCYKETVDEYLRAIYISKLKEIADFSLKKKIVLDCANGANSFIAKKVLERITKSLIIINASPNPKNINYNCGAMHPEILSKNVIFEKADLGIAFDGDADRVLFCDENGEIIDGDHVLGFISKHTNQEEIVYTDYSNLALDTFLKKCNISGIRVQNGDKYVSDELSKRGLLFGGEKSGHFIFKEYNESGDGLLSAIQLLKALSTINAPLSQIKEFELYPQVVVSAEVQRKKELNEIKGLQEMLEHAKNTLGQNARINLRYSGTEMKIRVLVEGNSQDLCNEIANKIAGFIKCVNS